MTNGQHRYGHSEKSQHTVNLLNQSSGGMGLGTGELVYE